MKTTDGCKIEIIRDEAIRFQKNVQTFILRTPTGDERNFLTDLNIHLMGVESACNKLLTKGESDA